MSRIATRIQMVPPARLRGFALAALTVVLAAVAWQVATPSRAAVSTVHVSTSGCRDAASWDEAATTPFCSLSKAIALAPSGGRIEVAAGSYPALTVTGGSRTSPVTVIADGSGAVSLPRISLQGGASYLTFSGLRITGGSGIPFEVQAGGHHVQLLFSELSSSGSDAVQLRPGAHDLLFDGLHVSTTGGGYGIVFAASSTLPGSPAGGHADTPIERVTIRRSLFDGVDGDAIRPSNFRDVLIEGNEFRNMRENGDHVDATQSVWGGTNLTFRGNFIHDNNTQGLFIKDGRVTNVVVENNIFAHNAAPCGNCGSVQIFLYDVDGATIVNNTVWDNATNVTIYRNVRGLSVRNNLFAYFDVGAATPDYSSGWQEDHNLIAGGNRGAHGAGDIGASRPPKFVDAAHGDYRLLPTSPGVDAGTSAEAPARDKVCAARVDRPETPNTGTGSPAYVDLGALETREGSSAADTASFGAPPCDGSIPVGPPGSGTGTGTATPPGQRAGAGGGGSGTTTGGDGGQAPGGTASALCACPSGGARCALPRVAATRRAAVVHLRASRTCRLRASAIARWHGGHARTVTVRRSVRAGHRVTVRIALPGSVRRALARGHRVRITVTIVGMSKRGGVVRQSRTVALRPR